MNNNISYDLIKFEFINIIKDYPNFPFNDKNAQIQVATVILDQAFRKTHIFVTSAEKNEILKKLLDNVVFGLRQIQIYQDDDSIEEIMINGLKNIYIKRRMSDKIEKQKVEFNSMQELYSVIEKLLEGSGRRVDRSSPLVDIRLSDGSRVNIIMEPLAINGPYITIRKFPVNPISVNNLIKNKTMNNEIYEFLKLVIDKKKNILISGATASGKTTTLSALTNLLNPNDRVVVIEETAEIKLPELIHNQIQIETRPSNIEGKGQFTIRDLLKNALRMRPDRIIIGEVRGEEAFDMLQALNTGHKGSFTTIHANSCEDALNRLEGMVLMAGFEQLSLSVIKTWIARSIDILIHQKYTKDGTRKIAEIYALDKKFDVNYKSELKLIPLFEYKKTNFKKYSKNVQEYIDYLKYE